MQWLVAHQFKWDRFSCESVAGGYDNHSRGTYTILAGDRYGPDGQREVRKDSEARKKWKTTDPWKWPEMFEWLRAQNALLTVADVQSRTIPTLRLELRARRLDCQGKRAELLERLEQAIRKASSS